MVCQLHISHRIYSISSHQPLLTYSRIDNLLEPTPFFGYKAIRYLQNLLTLNSILSSFNLSNTYYNSIGSKNNSKIYLKNIITFMYNPTIKSFISSRYFEVKLVIYYFRIPPKQKKLSEILCPSKKI